MKPLKREGNKARYEVVIRLSRNEKEVFIIF